MTKKSLQVRTKRVEEELGAEGNATDHRVVVSDEEERDMQQIEGQIIEFTLDGERRTAEAMLQSDNMVLLDFFDGDRPVLTTLDRLVDLEIFRPDDEMIAA